MTTAIHVGKKRDITVNTSDGSVIPPGALGVTSSNAALVSVSVNPATNVVTVTGVGSGGPVNVNLTATGYVPLTEVFTVAPLPTMTTVIGAEY